MPTPTTPAPTDGDRPRVVVVGAGFAGLTLVRDLASAPVEVVLVDQRNHHLFQPLLYQVATASLEPSDIAYPARGLVARQDNATFRLGRVTGVDWERRQLRFEEGEPLAFDRLVLAAGAETASFGIPGVEEHAFALKSLTDGLRFRDHLLREVERADGDQAAAERDGALTVAICGGGPTGVELAGATAELFHQVLARDFPHLDLGRARVVLAEMADQVLPGYPESQQRYAAEQLRERGVELALGAPVTRIRDRALELDDGTVVPAGTIVWTAGVRAHPLAEALDLELGPQRRITVEPSLAVPGHDGVWALGDLAAVRDEPHPQLAPVAIQQAHHVAGELRRHAQGRPPRPFHYRDRGTMATIGRRAAVANLPLGIRLRGTVGWGAWLLLHIVTLVGGHNRASVLLNWAWSYATWHRPGRLIIGTDELDEGLRSEPLPPRDRAGA